MSRQNTSAGFETLLQTSSLNLHIPEIGGVPTITSSDGEHFQKWWEDIEQLPSRDTAFFDEKVSYYVSLVMPYGPITGSPQMDEPMSAAVTFLSRLQLTMIASFLPSLPNHPVRRSSRQGRNGSADETKLAPPRTPVGNRSNGSDEASGILAPSTPNPFPGMREGEEGYAAVEGVTTWEGAVGFQDDQSASTAASLVSGSTSSDVNEEEEIWRKDGRLVIKTEKGWVVIWRGQLPVGILRPYTNPEPSSRTDCLPHSPRPRSPSSPDTPQKPPINRLCRSFASDLTAKHTTEIDTAEIDDIDLLAGLTGEIMPASRLGPSIQSDLSISPGSPTSPLSTADFTPKLGQAYSIPSTAGTTGGPSRERGNLPSSLSGSPHTTLRKSYRRVLSLSPGLKVRMRNLVLPQLIYGTTETNGEGEGEGEKRVVLCIEIENTYEGDQEGDDVGIYGFELEGVEVDIAGKGGKATAELVCDPNQGDRGGEEGEKVFPRMIRPIEQYNLLYAVTIASIPEESRGVDEAVAKSLGTGETSRPVSITVIGRPYKEDEDEEENDAQDKTTISKKRYPTKSFSSRWNCTLDLSGYLTQPDSSFPKHPFSPPPTSLHHQNNRYSTKPSPTTQNKPNAIAGDKRYSLAALLGGAEKIDRKPPVPSRVVSMGPGGPIPPGQQPPRPLMPSQLANANAPQRYSSLRPIPQNQAVDNEGLLISVKLLPQPRSSSISGNGGLGSMTPISPGPYGSGGQSGGGGIGDNLRVLEPFSIEVFVHNRTEEVRRFRLSVPSKCGNIGGGNVLDKRKTMMTGNGSAVPVRPHQHPGVTPAIIPLENDVRCGPLLPGASLSSRMRFMALRDGVHKIEKLRVTGANDEFDFLVSPVLDVIVGNSDPALS